MKWVALALPLVAAVGCREDEDGGPGGTPTVLAATFTVIYTDTGHPVSCETSDADVRARETELETLTNDHRVAMGRNALVPRDSVRAVSRAHSEHMISHAFFAHLNPETDQPWDRATRAGIVWVGYGENLAGGYATAQEAFNGFLASSGHRENIEDSQWTGHGDGYAFSPSSTYRWYWTQNFIRP